MNPIELLRRNNDRDFKQKYLEQHNLSEYKDSFDFQPYVNRVISFFNREEGNVLYGVVMIDKINSGYDPMRLSIQEVIIYNIVEDIYNISDNKYMIQFPIIEAIREYQDKSVWNLFFNEDGSLKQNIIKTISSAFN